MQQRQWNILQINSSYTSRSFPEHQLVAQPPPHSSERQSSSGGGSLVVKEHPGTQPTLGPAELCTIQSATEMPGKGFLLGLYLCNAREGHEASGGGGQERRFTEGRETTRLGFTPSWQTDLFRLL